MMFTKNRMTILQSAFFYVADEIERQKEIFNETHSDLEKYLIGPPHFRFEMAECNALLLSPL